MTIVNAKPVARFIAAFMILGGCVAAANADVRWVLTSADLQTQPIDLVAIDSGKVRYIDKQSVEQSLPIDQFVGAQAQVQTPRLSGGKLRFILTDGTSIVADAGSIKDENILFSSPILGEWTVPLNHVARLESVAKGASAKKNEPSKTEDVVQLSNGDSVHGVVQQVSVSTITIKTDNGPSNVPIDSITAVVFASTGPKAGAKTKGFLVRLDDGSSFTVDALTVQGSAVSLTLPAGPKQIDLGHFQAIEQVGGPVSWLSSRPPMENVQTPFLDVAWPVRMDQSVMGEPLRFKMMNYTRGIGVHSKSRLTWALDGSYKSFRTQYAIDGNMPYADVDVRILIDSKVVHEVKDFKAGLLSPVIAFDLGDARTLTLEVDFGAGEDVQDRLNWIEPALLRASAAPTTRPATQP